jgi:Uma2 family endonuclease
MAATPAPQSWTVEDYLRLDRSTPSAKYEYYDGYIVMMAGGSLEHSAIAANLHISIGGMLRGKDCRTFTSDARVQISAARYVYPDITISCDREDWGGGDILHSPRVVIEVLSPSTQNFDRNQKSDYYRACPSIQEYVLVSSDVPRVELYRRAEPFWQFAAYGLDEILTLASIEVAIPVTEIYRDIEFPPAPSTPESM